jgi:hypothetical protein
VLGERAREESMVSDALVSMLLNGGCGYLTVEGHKAEKGDTQYLYQDISARPFRRVFKLADYVEVKGATFEVAC